MKTLTKKFRVIHDGTTIRNADYRTEQTGTTYVPEGVQAVEFDTRAEAKAYVAENGLYCAEVAAEEIGPVSDQPPLISLADYKRIIDEYIEGVATAQEYDDATSFRSRAGYENAFQSAAIAFGQWSDAIYVWSSEQRENPPSTPPSLDEFRAMLVSEFPIPDLAVMAPKKTGVLAWFKSWFQQ